MQYMGGQAVLDGVMMRGADTWAVAVRLPDGSIVSSVQPVASWSQRYREIPVVRGVAALGESLALGYRALAWSADRQLAAVDPSADVSTDANEALSSRAVRATMLTAMAFFTVVFLVAPALAGRSLAHRLPLPFPVAEAIVRLGFFLGYLLLIGRVRDIRRVFEYHGAEHKAIAAYENGVVVAPAEAQRFTTAHLRCGTNFLLTVMVVAIVCYSAVPTTNLLVVVASRVVLLPVVAGLSYEAIRFAADNQQRRWVRGLMRPGLALQRLTTRTPSLDQIEVAIVALRACMTDDQRAEVDARLAA